MFWNWLLKYSSLLVTAALSFLVGWLLDRVTSRRSQLIFYTTQPQWVALPNPAPGQPTHLGVMTLFLWNAGQASAKQVHVGHAFLPPHSVYPDIPRDDPVPLPGGGAAVRFPIFPARTLVSVSYLIFPPATPETILAYVGSEDGPAKRIPVMLQRIFPKTVLNIFRALVVAGIWVVLNFALALVQFLWNVYYLR